MTRLPKKWGIAQAEGEKSLILRQMYFILCQWAGDNPIKVVRAFP
jgi:hypothetical protein